jgi:hypothetical protein
MTEAEKKMQEMLKGLKPEPGLHSLPETLTQPPRMPHPDLHPDGTLKE